jgi:regulator of protease activity HflC (stomatin/prohibitin superfamily)
MVMAIWLGVYSFLAGLILFIVICFVNSFVVVPQDYAAYATIFEEPPHKSTKAGWHFLLPFVTKVVNVYTKQDTYEITVENIDTAEVYKMGFKFAVKFGINPDEVWRIPGHVALPIETKHIYPILHELLIKHISPLTCQKLKDDEALRLRVMSDVKAEFAIKVEESFLKLRGVGVTDFIQDLELLFNDFQYDPIFVQRINDLEAARIQAEIAEQQKKAQIKEAQAVAESTEIIATADAKAIELKGSAENKVLRRKGEILTEKPAISENEVAKHYPQVVGGVMPTLSIKEMLNSGSTTPSTPTPPTP